MNRAKIGMAVAVFLTCGCAVYTRTITSDPPGAIIYSGASSSLLGPIIGSQTPATFTAFGWAPYCFRVGKYGYGDSDVRCLPGGNENQSLHFDLHGNAPTPSAAPVAASSPAPAPAKPTSPKRESSPSGTVNWTAHRNVDSMTDRVTCVAYYRGNTKIQLTADSLAISYSGRGGVSMGQWRIDDNAPLQRLATDVEKQIGAFFWEGSELARVLAGKRLRVQMFTILSTIEQDDLDLTGVVEVWQALREQRC